MSRKIRSERAARLYARARGLGVLECRSRRGMAVSFVLGHLADQCCPNSDRTTPEELGELKKSASRGEGHEVSASDARQASLFISRKA